MKKTLYRAIHSYLRPNEEIPSDFLPLLSDLFHTIVDAVAVDRSSGGYRKGGNVPNLDRVPVRIINNLPVSLSTTKNLQLEILDTSKSGRAEIFKLLESRIYQYIFNEMSMEKEFCAVYAKGLAEYIMTYHHVKPILFNPQIYSAK